jgi:hypothetical protein
MLGSRYIIPELFQRKKILWGAAANIGEVLSVDMSGGDYVRVRVWLDVRKDLIGFVSINPEELETIIMRVKYEKIPRFYAICGLLGHVKEECGTGDHSPGKEKYGKWLLADTAWNRAQLMRGADQNAKPPRKEYSTSNPPSGRGGRSGRGGAGRGGAHVVGAGRAGTRASVDNCKRNSAAASLTEVSPIKTWVPLRPLRCYSGRMMV